MTGLLSQVDLMASLRTRAQGLDLQVRSDQDSLAGEKETILAKWPLGQRKVAYKMSMRLSEPDHVVRFRDMVKETSKGLPPPTLTVETTTVKGWERSGSRSDSSLGGGGGKQDYGQVREALKEAVSAAGWQFVLEGGKAP